MSIPADGGHSRPRSDPPIPTCLVTGGSSGIGAAIARELHGRGRHVTLVARRREVVRATADEFSASGSGALALEVDLADQRSRQSLLDTVSNAGLYVDVLVNCAGFATSGPVAETDRARQLGLVRTNIEAVTDLCCALVPAMVERGHGHVLNVASTAAFHPVPLSASYAASKAFVLSYTEALHTELAGTGVSATALCPGPVRTPFADIATDGHADELRFPSIMWSSAEHVAGVAVDAMLDGRRVLTPGWANHLSATVASHLPHSLLLPALHRFAAPSRESTSTPKEIRS
jgi:uncharacterized protein